MNGRVKALQCPRDVPDVSAQVRGIDCHETIDVASPIVVRAFVLRIESPNSREQSTHAVSEDIGSCCNESLLAKFSADLIHLPQKDGVVEFKVRCVVVVAPANDQAGEHIAHLFY